MKHSLVNLEFIKQLHHDSLTTFILGSGEPLLQPDEVESNQVWTILNYYQTTNHSQSDQPISIHFSSLTRFNFLQSEFINLFKLSNQKKNDTVPIHLHLPLNEEILDLLLSSSPTETAKTNQTNPYFRYTGPRSPTDVYILLNTFNSSQLKFTLRRLLPEEIKDKIGLIEIKILKPWSVERFLKVLPSSTKTIRVFSNQSDLLLNLILNDRSDHKRLQEINISPLLNTYDLDSLTWMNQIQKDLRIIDCKNHQIEEWPRRLDQDEKLIIFWDLIKSPDNQTHNSNRIVSSLNSQSNQILNEYDNFSNLNSIRRHSIFISNHDDDQNDMSIKSIIQNYSPTLLVIEDYKELSKTYNLTSKIKSTTNLLFISNTLNEFKDLETQIDIETRYKLWKTYPSESLLPKDQNSNLGKLYHLNLVELFNNDSLVKAIVIEIVVLILLLNELNDEEILERFKIGTSTGEREEEEMMITSELIGKIRNHIETIEIPYNWQNEEMNEISISERDGKMTKKPDEILYKSTQSISLQTEQDDNPSKSINQTSIQKQILFPEFYQSTYLLEVIENRRLTPKDYDRNVFHLSLSTRETKLNYLVGDAIGIYGWNEEKEIKSFIKWLQFEEDEIIELRFSNQEELHSSIPQYTTIFKYFQQFLDLLGKPTKSFYESLSKKVTRKVEKDILRFLSSSLGTSKIKKLSEIDKLNYMDIIKRYAKSHCLTIYEIISMIPLIKPRHYSIASSQNFNPNSIDLKGQCTGYLNQLKIGDQVLVILKDSVMRLPEVSTQPIIMAGLGTGMAPFRAFIQERAYQRNVKGLEIGPILYYFGSRSKFSEYLYGEEIEKFLFEGIITHTGLSFSRDSSSVSKKQYIQDLMRLDQSLIIRLLLNFKGHFYLCGPTWPVQDIYNVILDGILRENGLSDKEVGVKILEGLKDEERYVLEVY
ncbi:hypothetical protein DFH28DRAFT_1091325 [Melampsora americana]|nr:hypothetical protein DFH28DRAFT_1091325 [Melampsora americana]